MKGLRRYKVKIEVEIGQNFYCPVRDSIYPQSYDVAKVVGLQSYLTVALCWKFRLKKREGMTYHQIHSAEKLYEFIRKRKNKVKFNGSGWTEIIWRNWNAIR